MVARLIHAGYCTYDLITRGGLSMKEFYDLHRMLDIMNAHQHAIVAYQAALSQ